MPVYRLRGSQSTTPWNNFQEWLGSLPNGKDVFRKAQTRLGGFVIARWEHLNSNVPTHYFVEAHFFYSRSGSNRILDGYNTIWGRFDDDTASDNPKQYVNLSKALKMIDKLREIEDTERIGLILWTHPDAHYAPEERYVLMGEGNKFPGSPKH